MTSSVEPSDTVFRRGPPWPGFARRTRLLPLVNATLTRSGAGVGSGAAIGGGGIGVGATAGAGAVAELAAATIGRSTRLGEASQDTPTTTHTARNRPVTTEGQWIGATSVALTERSLDISCGNATLITASDPRRWKSAGAVAGGAGGSPAARWSAYAIVPRPTSAILSRCAHRPW